MFANFLCKYNPNKTQLPQVIKHLPVPDHFIFPFHIAAQLGYPTGSGKYNTAILNIGKLELFPISANT